MKHLFIGPAEVTSDPATLMASYGIADITADGAPAVPYDSGADGHNNISVGDVDLLFYLGELGLRSMFFGEDGLMAVQNEGRAVAISQWMSVRLDDARSKYLVLYPDAATQFIGSSVRRTYDLVTWLDFWFAYALADGVETGPAAFYWSQS